MTGKVLWCSFRELQKMMVPRPPPHLMPSDEEVQTIHEALEDLLQNYHARARLANVQDEDYLAEHFVAILNDTLLQSVAGASVGDVNCDTFKPSSPTHSLEGESHTALPSRTFRATVPGCVFGLSSHKPDQIDPAHSKALFDEGIEPDGGHKWTYQRLLVDFECAGVQNDPFEDKSLRDLEPDAVTPVGVRGQLIAYADRVFAHQHRSGLFSLCVIDREFRFMWWDRSGVMVSEKVDYIQHTRLLLEFLVGFLILDDASQGIDMAAELLLEGSSDWEFMDLLARNKAKGCKLNVLSHHPGTTVDQQEFAAEPSHQSNPVPANCSSEHLAYTFSHVLNLFLASLSPWPRYRLSIGTDTFLVGRPLHESPGFCGGGTRVYVAWHEQACNFTFLKDTWRPLYEGVEAEGDVLAMLNNARVDNVPRLVCHADIASQVTATSRVWVLESRTNKEGQTATEPEGERADREVEGIFARPTKKRKIAVHEPQFYVRHLRHSRLAVADIGLPLSDFRDSKQLVEIVRDAYEAHHQAVTRCNRIHRDITGGNIVIVPRLLHNPLWLTDKSIPRYHVVWQGMLSDWESGKPVAELGGRVKIPARQPERTGTWMYMPLTVQQDPMHVVDIADETESFFHVLLHTALEYVQLTPENTARMLVSAYFHSFVTENGVRLGGGVKQTVLKAGTLSAFTYSPDQPIIFGTHEESNAVLNTLVSTLLRMFSARYAVLDHESHRRRSVETMEAESKRSPPHCADQCNSSFSSQPYMDGSARTPSIKTPSVPSGGSQSPTQQEWYEEVDRSSTAGYVPPPLIDCDPGGWISSVPEPSQEMRELAEKLTTHEEVRNILLAMTKSEPYVSKWPANDRKEGNAVVYSASETSHCDSLGS